MVSSSITSPADQPPELPSLSPNQGEQEERRALSWAALVAVAIIAWIVMPVSVGIFFGMLLAFMAEPLFERLKPRLGVNWAALLIVALSTFALAASVGGFAWLFVAKGTVITQNMIAWLSPNGPGHELLTNVGKLTERIGISPDELSTKTRGWAEGAALHAAVYAQVIVEATARALLALFFTILSMHFILRHWHRLALRTQEAFPLRPTYTAMLFNEFRRVGRTTLMGTVVTGIAQGVLAMLGFWIAGVPEPAFFGAATAVASLIPAVGTLLVWVPLGIIWLLTGHAAGGIMVLAWGGAIIEGVAGYIIRPRLLRGEGGLPTIVTFAALFGGVAVFGLKGLIIGPVLMTMAIAVLRLYASEAQMRRTLKDH